MEKYYSNKKRGAENIADGSGLVDSPEAPPFYKIDKNE